MSKTMTAEERYTRDPHFHALVHQLYDLLIGARFTSTELREALILALIKYEREHPRPMSFSSTEATRWAELLEPRKE